MAPISQDYRVVRNFGKDETPVDVALYERLQLTKLSLGAKWQDQEMHDPYFGIDDAKQYPFTLERIAGPYLTIE